MIHDELSVGQTRDLYRSIRTDAGMDTAGYPVAKALAYLKAWSFVMANGDPAPISTGALELMKSARFAEIIAALDAHEATHEQEKKPMTTAAPGSVPILQSVA